MRGRAVTLNIITGVMQLQGRGRSLGDKDHHTIALFVLL